MARRLPAIAVIENLEDLIVEKVMEQFDMPREQFPPRRGKGSYTGQRVP